MLHPKMKHIYVGIDTHKKTHTAVIINCWNEKLDEITFDNKPAAYEDLLKMVSGHLDKGIKPIFGLEDVTSVGRALTMFLLKHKHMVKYVNSSHTYSERHNQTILHKTDSHDAYCIAKVLLNDLDSLPEANINDQYWIFKQLVWRRRSLIDINTKLKNQLHSQIQYNYPSYTQFFGVFACLSALEFWSKYPSSDYLMGANAEEVTKVLREASGSVIPVSQVENILTLAAADGYIKSENQESRNALIRSLVHQIRFNLQEIGLLEEAIQNKINEFPYKLQTFPNVCLATASDIIAEIGDINRFTSAAKLAKYCGIAPVTVASGQKDVKIVNRLGNRHLNSVIYFLALRTISVGKKDRQPKNPVFYEYYHKKISQGKTKNQAVKCVMRRLIAIIYAMMKNETEYKMVEVPIEKAV